MTTTSTPITTTITFDIDVSAFGALRLSPSEFAREMRVAAAVQWYAQGIVSQGKAAELADLTRAEFLQELHHHCHLGELATLDNPHSSSAKARRWRNRKVKS